MKFLLSYILCSISFSSWASTPIPPKFYPCTEFSTFEPSQQALYYAIKNKNVDLALKVLTDVSNVNYCTPDVYQSVLDLAIIQRSVPLVKKLLEKGADVNCSKNCSSPMFYVVNFPNKTREEEKDATAIGQLLIDYDIEFNDSDLKQPEDWAYIQHCSAISCAARQGNLGTIEWLMNRGLSIDPPRLDPKVLNSYPYHSYAQFKVVNVGASALVEAIKRDDFPMVRFCLENGANPNLKRGSIYSAYEQNPLIAAVYFSKSKSKMVELLVSYGANVNAFKNHLGQYSFFTPMKIAKSQIDEKVLSSDERQNFENVIKTLQDLGEIE